MGVRFGDCEFDREARSLTRAGRRVPLTPKAFELLAALLEARPRALSRAELIDRLWPGTYVSHSSLPRVVAEARRAIGDTRRDARFLRTVHGFGYAFTVDPGPAVTAARSAEPSLYGVVWRAREIPLGEGETLIGRAADCGVRLDSPDVSRHHARLLIAQGQASIEDLGSKNGTSVRGRPARGKTPLVDGIEILVGPEVLIFRMEGAMRSTRTRRRRRS